MIDNTTRRTDATHTHTQLKACGLPTMTIRHSLICIQVNGLAAQLRIALRPRALARHFHIVFVVGGGCLRHRGAEEAAPPLLAKI